MFTLRAQFRGSVQRFSSGVQFRGSVKGFRLGGSFLVFKYSVQGFSFGGFGRFCPNKIWPNPNFVTEFGQTEFGHVRICSISVRIWPAVFVADFGQTTSSNRICLQPEPTIQCVLSHIL